MPEPLASRRVRFRVASAPSDLGIFVEADRAMVLEIPDPTREPTREELDAFNFVGIGADARPIATHRLIVRALELAGVQLDAAGKATPRVVERDRIVFDVIANGAPFEIVLFPDLTSDRRGPDPDGDFSETWLAYDLAVAHLLSNREELEKAGFDFSAVDAEPPWPVEAT